MNEGIKVNVTYLGIKQITMNYFPQKYCGLIMI